MLEKSFFFLSLKFIFSNNNYYKYVSIQIRYVPRDGIQTNRSIDTKSITDSSSFVPVFN